MRLVQATQSILLGVFLTIGSFVSEAGQQSATSGKQTVTARCDSISGGKAKVTSVREAGCLRCAVKKPYAAADDQAKSFASLEVFSSSLLQGISIRATAQRGIVYPAGGRAGVFFSRPDNDPNGDNIDSGGSYSLGIGTYLGGKLQESAGLLNTNEVLSEARTGGYNFPGGSTLANEYVYIQTTKPYDAVELYVTDTQVRVGGDGQTEVGSAPYKVYEICSDGFVSPYPGR